MFKWWKSYLERKFQEMRKKEEQEKVRIEEETRAKKEEENRLAEEAKIRYVEKMKKSNEPWFDVTSEGHVPELGIKIVTDWNSAMIKYLRANGFTGTSEEEVVYSYIRAVSKDLERSEYTAADFSDISEEPDMELEENVE